MDYNPIAPALRDVLTAIRHRKRVDEVVELILDRACQIANALHGSFITVDHQTRRLIITSTHGPDWTLEKQACQLRLGQGITGRVAATGIAHLCGDVTRDPEYYPLFDYVRSELAVPVIVNDQVWGIINMDGLSVHAFNENTLATLSVFAELASFAITLRLEVNEQERLQRHLVQSEKLASLGEIIAGIAHEINNPLTSVLAHASLLTLKRGRDTDEQSVQAILNESRRAADLVKSLLSFSRKEAGGKEIIGINELINRACSIKRYQLKVNNISLMADLDQVSFPVYVSAQQVQQVFLNLINNAEQAIPPSRKDGTIRVTTKRYGEKVRISVSDNGTGIPSEVQKFIFDPFFTTKPLGEGTGLGLSIAHSIIETHGGDITVESSSSRGSCFTVELPLALSPETPRQTAVSDPDPDSTMVAPSEPASPGAPARPTGKVLLVDDEPQILESLSDYLEIMDVQAKSAGDVQIALELLRKESFDVIVSDIRMPGTDGLRFYEMARALDKRYSRNFIFMSGDLVRESTKSFVNASGCVCLEKPFSLATLYKTLVPHFHRAAAATESAGK
ncbi:MAG TPA: ATP-binding protein [Candidatus Methylacidiphilales bacterium]|nr:ATP-binding protein [Candidatus Methylacidiphilales bacterium]